MVSFSSCFEPLSFPRLGLVRFPKVTPAPEELSAMGLKPDASLLTYLKTLAWRGYLEKARAGKLPHVSRDDAIARLKLEFDVFSRTGTLGYIAMIHQILHWCDQNGVPRGPARGSCAASFAFYCIGITKIDPIRFGLTFTRFISEARVKPTLIDGEVWADGKMVMDVDIDVGHTDRDRVIDYLKAAFPGAVAGIANLITLSAKVALKDTVKVYLGYSEEEAKRVSDWVEVRFGKSASLSEAFEACAELRAWVDENPKNAEAFAIARAIEDSPHSKGQHASGYYIGYEPLERTVPTEMTRKDQVVTVYDMNTVALLGVKIDLLNLRNLNVIKDTCDMIGMRFDDIDVTHPSIYEYIGSSSHYNGLFQISEGLTADAVFKIKPRNIDQLGACIAISRPGAMKYIDAFAAYVNKGEIKAIHPQFDAILKETGNILIYQEQINEVLQQVYHISAVLAEDMRRAVGKKVREDLLKFEPILYEQGEKHGVTKDVTKYFWDVCNSSADYLFNKSHSASYSYITAYTIYLKANHPREFTLALLRMSKHEQKPQEALTKTLQECRETGIIIQPPDILLSQDDFDVDKDGHIRFGLSSIRGISDGTMPKLGVFRKQEIKTRFQLFEAAKSAGLNITALANLIYSGCLGSVGGAGVAQRSYLALQAQLYNLLTDREKPLVHRLAPDYGDDLIPLLKDLPNRKDEKGRALIKESRLLTLRRDYAPYWEGYKTRAANEELSTYLAERQLLGFSYSSSLHRVFSTKVEGLVRLIDLSKRPVPDTPAPPEGAPKPRAPRPEVVKVVAFISEVKRCVSRKDASPYLRLLLTDDDTEFRCLVHGAERVKATQEYNGGELKEGMIVIVTGSLSKDGTVLFADTIAVQPNPIATKRGPHEDDPS